MAYRTLKEPGFDAKAFALKGLKITKKAQIIMSHGTQSAKETQIKGKMKELRQGVSTNNGAYHLNGFTVNHTHVDGVLAIAWRESAGYIYVEGLIKHSNGNNYLELQN